jgi:hypothetical protein
MANNCICGRFIDDSLKMPAKNARRPGATDARLTTGTTDEQKPSLKKESS